jgi:hypothetical protein
MRPIIDVKGPPEPGQAQEPLIKRLGWFVFYWACVAALTLPRGNRAEIRLLKPRPRPCVFLAFAHYSRDITGEILPVIGGYGGG